MGHRLLHQSHAAGGIGAIPARSANSHDSGEKVKAGGRKAPPQPPKTLARFVILQDSARYPSGPRERSAKPPFVGSNPTRASTFLPSNQLITTFASFPESPTWEQLEKERAPDFQLHAGVCLELHACRN